MNIKKIKDQLIQHEGLKLKPYQCPAGRLTIGVGRNLEDKGITEKLSLSITFFRKLKYIKSLLIKIYDYAIWRNAIWHNIEIQNQKPNTLAPNNATTQA